jgi:MinD-like ATPase involved in chromosome partitioning or flagellar assembly
MSHDQPHGQPAHRSDQGPPPNGHGQPPNGWHEFEPDTSERLYTSEEFAAYSDARLRQAENDLPQAPAGDPLTDPMPGEATQVRPAYDGQYPPQAPPSPIAAPPQEPWMAPGGPEAAPQSAPQAAPQETYRPPTTTTPVAAAPVAAAPTETAAEPDADGDGVRRFMTATDFLDRRSEQVEVGPATWGWRGRVRRWTGGAISPKMGPAEYAFEMDRRSIQRDFDGPRTIAFLNPKGGAAKTTGVLAAGYTFGTVRGGGVVAWDNNETRGTLGIRGTRSTHRNTTRELLEDLEKFSDVYQARIGDLGAFVRSQGDAHFDVLASDERPDVTGMIRAQDFTAVHQLLERFYRMILIDTGNNMRAENWLAAAERADLLVVTSTIREDTGYSGLWMLDALQDAGYQNLKHKTVTVLSDPSQHVDQQLAHDLTQVYEQRTKHVFRVPYDPVLVAGSVVPYAQLSEGTQMAWLKACAGMSGLL